jgi:peptide/nickel transport system ATP-binding protein
MKDLTHSIHIGVGGRTLVALDSFSLAANRITFLFGESGIGKSLIYKALYGLLDPEQYTVVIDNLPYAAYRSAPQTRTMQQQGFFVFQEPSTHLNPLQPLSRQLNEGSLAESRHEREILEHLWEKEHVDRLDEIMNLYPQPFRPSGGEKQRILLAMAFKKLDLLPREESGRPVLFVFDEPTGSLDNRRRNLFLNLLFGYRATRPFTAVVITHDYSIISEVCTTHRRFLEAVSFRELSRDDAGQLHLRDFEAGQYLGWLRHTQPPARRSVETRPVLDVADQFTVFNRGIGIYRDAGHTQKSNLTIRPGEMVYLKAPSGVGKTTLAKLVMGLLEPQQFRCRLGEHSLNETTPPDFWRRKIWAKSATMVFQHADEALNLQATVRETFAGLPGRFGRRAAVLSALELLFDPQTAESLLNKKVGWLSGGQKQRLNILRSMVLDTALLVLDEPLNGLDFESIRKVLALLERKRRDGTAILLVSHNEEIFDAMTSPEQIFHLAAEGD